MPSLNLNEINWLAVAVAALATFMLGGVWYQALFGKLWVRLHGYSSEKVKQMQAAKPPALFFGLMIVAYFLLAVVVALLVQLSGADELREGLLLGFLLWLGPAVALGLTGWLASDRHFGIFAIDFAYQLIFLLGQGAILATWR